MDNTEEINDRVAKLIKALGMNANSFSVAIGVEGPVIHNIVKGRRSKPSYDVLQKILLAFDNINSEWLMVGKGDIFKDAHQNAHPYAHLFEENKVLNEDSEEYKASKMKRLEYDNMVLKAQNDALYKAFRELGSSRMDDSSSKTA